jgi:hypothetical protein
MRGYLGKLEVKSVREGEGRMPMQFAVPGVTREDLSALLARFSNVTAATRGRPATPKVPAAILDGFWFS